MDRIDGFDRFDEVEVPDQWGDIERRADAIDAPEFGSDSAARRRSAWVLVGAAAAVIGMLAGFLAIDRDGRDTQNPDDGIILVPAPGDVLSTPDEFAVTAGPSSSTRSSSASTSPAAVEANVLPCESEGDLAEIAALLRSGQPTYDYQPARDLEQLVDWSDVVVTGTIVGVQRLTRSGAAPEPGTDGDTMFDLADVQVLAGDGSVGVIGSPSLWASGQGADPLAERIEFDGLRFVAFLRAFPQAVDGWLSFVDGFAFGCDGLGTPAGQVGPNPIEPVNELPPGVPDMSISEIGAEVRRIVNATDVEVATLTRPVFPADVCRPISARESRPFDGLEAVFFRMDEVFPIQIFGETETTPADPYALVQRVENWQYGLRGEVTEINGYDVGIGTFENGNGEAVWSLGDGTTGYLRSRGLDRADIIEIVRTLQPRQSDEAIRGFDVVSGENVGFVLLHEQMNTDVRGAGVASSECLVEATGAVYRLSLVEGDPVLQYAAVIDQSPPTEVGTIGGSTLILSGGAGAGAPTLADAVDADPTTFEDLLGQPDAQTQLNTPPDVAIGDGADVELELFDATGIELESGPFVVRLVDEVDPTTGEVAAVFLEVDSSRITFHPDARVEVTYIDGRARGRGTAKVGGVAGMRLTDGDRPEPFELSIRIVDGDPEDTAGEGDRILQITPTIRLVPV